MMPTSIIQASSSSAQEFASLSSAPAVAQVSSLYAEPHVSDTPLIQAIKQRINLRKESDLIVLHWITESNEASQQKQLDDHLSARNWPIAYPAEAECIFSERTVDLRKKLSTIAFLRDNLPVVNAMIASDAHINQASAQNHRRTPVMLAAAYCDLPVVKSLLARSDVDVLLRDASGETARDLARLTSLGMYQGDSGYYEDDCDSVIKLLKKKEIKQMFQQRFVDEVNRRRITQGVLTPQNLAEEQLLPRDLSDMVGEYIVPRPEFQRSNQPAAPSSSSAQAEE